MPKIYVVDVPEFRPIIESARDKEGYSVAGPVKGYYRIETAGEMMFNRKEMQLPPAIWYGMFTGGMDGEIKSFGRDKVTVIGTNKPL